jgi:four helix bundle protein
MANSLPFHVGMSLAVASGMSVKKLEDLVAYQLAVECKKEVYRLVQAHPTAHSDFRYRSQVYESAASAEANIAEGWRRYGARDMSRFLKYALGSIEETKRRVTDGAHRGYFSEEACEPALALARRCGAATMGLWKSLGPYR